MNFLEQKYTCSHVHCSSIYSHIYNSLDEIKVLLDEKFDNFSKKLISIEEKFDTIIREIYIKMEQIEKKAEDAKASGSNNSDEIEVKV